MTYQQKKKLANTIHALKEWSLEFLGVFLLSILFFAITYLMFTFG